MGKASRRKRESKTKPRGIELPLEVIEWFQEQRKLFVEKFGREPGPEDPICFDPTKDQPQPMDDHAVGAQIVNVMAQAGIAPEYIYAYEETGLMPSTANQDLLSDADLEQWDAAIAEYHSLTNKSVQ
jgi:hypothetical protein